MGGENDTKKQKTGRMKDREREREIMNVLKKETDVKKIKIRKKVKEKRG